MKIVIAGAVAVFLLFYVMTSPDQAAHIVHSTWSFLGHLAHGFGHFVDKVSS